MLPVYIQIFGPTPGTMYDILESLVPNSLRLAVTFTIHHSGKNILKPQIPTDLGA
jgi:hypothetical protein